MKPQNEFPLLDTFSKVFDITPRTIFAYDKNIYCDYPLTDDLLIHEQTHLAQQEKYGLDKWVEEYLTNSGFRLEMELEAYRNQIVSINDRNQRVRVRIQSAKDLSSSLYGNIISYDEALKFLS